jgi:hypothetical protein
MFGAEDDVIKNLGIGTHSCNPCSTPTELWLFGDYALIRIMPGVIQVELLSELDFTVDVSIRVTPGVIQVELLRSWISQWM